MYTSVDTVQNQTQKARFSTLTDKNTSRNNKVNQDMYNTNRDTTNLLNPEDNRNNNLGGTAQSATRSLDRRQRKSVAFAIQDVDDSIEIIRQNPSESRTRSRRMTF